MNEYTGQKIGTTAVWPCTARKCKLPAAYKGKRFDEWRQIGLIEMLCVDHTSEYVHDGRVRDLEPLSAYAAWVKENRKRPPTEEDSLFE